MKRGWLRAVAAAAVVGLGAVAASGAAAVALTRRRAPPAPEPVRRVLGAEPEILRLTSEDGVSFGAWFFARPEADCAVILAHGLGGSRSRLLGLSREVLELGCHALPITLRAHGDSGGDVNDFGYSGRLEIVAASAWLAERHPEARQLVIGVSMGAAAALFAAPMLEDRVQGYLLESPYESLAIAIRNRLEMRLPDALVGPGFSLLSLWSDAVLPVPLEALAPVRAAARFPPQARLLVLAGAEDRLATPDEAANVVQAAPAGARLEVFEGAAHSELWTSDPARYRRLIRDLVTGTATTPPTRRAAPPLAP